MLLNDILSMLMGIVAGLVTGTGLFAFLAALGVFSKMQRAAGSKHMVNAYVCVTLAGIILGLLSDMFMVEASLPAWLTMFFGFFGGAFVGIIIISLAEVLNILPLLYKAMPNKQLFTAAVVVFGIGKMVGAFIEALAPQFL